MLTKNRYKDQDVWIVGAGESINKQDLSLLKEKNVILANKTIKLVLENKCTFDNFAWVWNDMLYLPEVATYTGIPYEKSVVGIEKKMRSAWAENWNKHEAIMQWFKYFVPFDCETVVERGNFTYNIEDCTYCGWTIVIDLAIPLAMWWGAKNIYLVGCDCEGNHYDAPYKYSNDDQIELTKACFNVVRKFADNNGFKVCNAGLGGTLESFERIDYNVALGEKK